MSDCGAILRLLCAITRPMRRIQFYRPHTNPPRCHRNRLNMLNWGQETISCEITSKNLFLRYLVDSGPLWRRKYAFSRPSPPLQFYRLHGKPSTYQAQRLGWLNPGRDGISDKITGKNLILRQRAEIDALWALNKRSLDPACKFSSID